MRAPSDALPGGSALVVGLAVTGEAVARALVAHGVAVVAVDDGAGGAARARAGRAGIELIEAPDDATLASLVREASMVLPTPGLPDRHPVFAAAAAAGVSILSEFDLAAAWDDRPLLAITGTDGKTTVTTLVTAMLVASGIAAVAAGNTDVPLVAALDDPATEVFVVEASSFRLGHTRRFTPAVATWLNLAPDHQDVHASLDAYERAKARIWRDQGADDVAVGNADDPVVLDHLRHAPARQVTFGVDARDAGYHVAGGSLVDAAGEEILPVHDLWRAFPHDLANALAASATASHGGATLDGVREALRDFEGLRHRVELVGEADGVRYYDDSKATAPHATLAALRAFDSAVLIAGGRNKGLDLRVLADAADRIRAVVAIGAAAADVAAAFDGVRPVVVANDMREAVVRAAELAEPGDAVLLSPGCASFDWYGSYAERGDDFTSAVRRRLDEVRA